MKLTEEQVNALPPAVRKMHLDTEAAVAKAAETPPTEPVEEETPAETPPAEPAEETPAEETPAETLPKGDEPAPKEESPWEQRYKTLQGKYNAETARMRQERDALARQLAGAPKLAEPALAAPKKAQSIKDLLTAEELEAITNEGAFDDRELDIMFRLSSKIAEAAARQAVEPISRVAAETRKDVTASGMNAFWNSVDSQIGTSFVETLNNDPDFLEYLDSPVPFTGGSVAVRTLAQEAINSRNATALLEVVESYRKAKGKSHAPAAPGKKPPISPPRSAPAAPQVSPKDIPVTQDFMNQHYHKARRGAQHYPGGVEAYNKNEKIINAFLAKNAKK